MSIQRLQRATVAGVVAQREEILEALQAFGGLHLIDLHQHSVREEHEPLLAPAQYQEALRYLENCSDRRTQIVEAPAFDPLGLAEQVLAIRDQARSLRDRRDFVGKRIEDLKPWGNFCLPADTLYGERLWFYLLPNFEHQALANLPLPWACVHRDNRYTYVAVISSHEPDPQLLPVPRTHTGSVPLEELRREHHQLTVQLEDLEAQRHGLTRWIGLFRQSLAAVEDRDARRMAELMALDNDQVFALQGWVAESEIQDLRSVAMVHSLALIFEPPASEDNPPTLLCNPPALAGGEDIVRFYQMPNYRAWDPSRVVFFSFALFFALILSDAGYAAVIGILLLAGWQRLGGSESGRRMRTLTAVLAAVSLLYGVLVGSYFGAGPPVSALSALHLIDMNDFERMMQISVVIGVLHLVLANLISAWQQRHSSRAIGTLGWVWMLCGALGYWLWQITTLAWLLGGLGLLSVLACSSNRGWHSPRDWMWRLAEGVLALTGVSKMFGDVLSYLRLFALGLASASLALTFNQLAQDVGASAGGIGFVLQLLILLLGHLVNFVLAVVSGVIHGLRLNLLEFFNWSLSDEGYAFQPFAKKEV
ncbi:MAG TPA: V-type ATP synthase subunit I [Motiliproteus sp.]